MTKLLVSDSEQTSSAPDRYCLFLLVLLKLNGAFEMPISQVENRPADVFLTHRPFTYTVRPFLKFIAILILPVLVPFCS